MLRGVLTDSPVFSGVKESYLPKIYVSCHAATACELDNGDFLCAWFSGTGEGNTDTTITMSRFDCKTQTWGNVDIMSFDPERSQQNPVLFNAGNGEVWLFHPSNEPHNQRTAVLMKRVSYDNGVTWGPAEVLFDKIGTFVKQPVVIMDNGEWLLPIEYCTYHGDYCAVKISADHGATWEEHIVPNSIHRIQMSVVEIGKGKLYAIFRSASADFIYESHSDDYGRSWSEPTPTVLRNNHSGMQMTKLRSGRVALLFNNTNVALEYKLVGPDGTRKKAYRDPLTIAFTDDFGKNWHVVCNIQERKPDEYRGGIQYSYPMIFEDSNKNLQCFFTYNRAEIKQIVLPPDFLDKMSDKN